MTLLRMPAQARKATFMLVSFIVCPNLLPNANVTRTAVIVIISNTCSNNADLVHRQKLSCCFVWFEG